MPRNGRTRVNGPYRHGRRWRLALRAPDGTQSFESFETEAEARAAKRAIELSLGKEDAWARVAELEEQAARARAAAEAQGGQVLTVALLAEQYEGWQREQGRRPGTITTAGFRLRALLRPIWNEPARAVTARRAQAIYKERAAEVAVDTHRNELGQVRTLWSWAVKRHLAQANVWAEVEPIGERSLGKEQPRPSEARQLYEAALEDTAALGDSATTRKEGLGALAVLCVLVLGQRPGEVVALTPRDVDSGWAWVQKGKTKNATRRVEIPEPLLGLLERRAREVRAESGTRLFPRERAWVLKHVKRLCKRAGIPEVTAHGLRGLHGTLAVDGGATSSLVAAQLGHGSTAVTERHYLAPGATAAAAQRRVLDVLGASQQGAIPSASGRNLATDGDGNVAKTQESPGLPPEAFDVRRDSDGLA